MSDLTAAQWVASSVAILGAYFITSLRPQVRFLAFALWCFSNALLTFIFAVNHLWPLVGMQAVFLVTSIVGCVRNFASQNGKHADAHLAARAEILRAQIVLENACRRRFLSLEDEAALEDHLKRAKAHIART